MLKQIWSNKEENILKQTYPKEPYTEVLGKLPKRTWRGVQGKANRMGLIRLVEENGVERISIYNSIRLKRERYGLTQNDLSKISGVNAETISRIERGEGASSLSICSLRETLDKYGQTHNGKRLTVFEKGWLSALIDGEGSIIITIDKMKRHYKTGDFVYEKPRARVQIANNCLELLEQAQRMFGSGAIVEGKGEHKGQFMLTVSSMKILKETLPQLLPHFIVKKDKAKNAIAFLKQREKIPWGQRTIRVREDF